MTIIEQLTRMETQLDSSAIDCTTRVDRNGEELIVTCASDDDVAAVKALLPGGLLVIERGAPNSRTLSVRIPAV